MTFARSDALILMFPIVVVVDKIVRRDTIVKLRQMIDMQNAV